RAAKHLSELIGKAQLERVRESKPARWFQRRHRTYSTERVVDPVVMESEIQGLEDLHGYFVQQDKVVPIQFKPQPKRNVAPGLVERIVPPVQRRPLDPEPAAKIVTASAQDPGLDMVSKLVEVKPEQMSIELGGLLS